MRKAMFIFIGIILIVSLWVSFYKNGDFTDDKSPKASDVEASFSTTGGDLTARASDKLAPLKLPIVLYYHWGKTEISNMP